MQSKEEIQEENLRRYKALSDAIAEAFTEEAEEEPR